MSSKARTSYPPGTPMHREELEHGVLSEGKFDAKAQFKLETHRKELIDLLGRVSGWDHPIDTEARIRLIDKNVDLAAARVRTAKLALAKEVSQTAEESKVTDKGKRKEETDEGCDDESDCSLPEDEFAATLTPYIKETLQSSLNFKVQTINAQCEAEGLAAPDRESAVCRALQELREKVEEGSEEHTGDEEQQLVSSIALKILDEFAAQQQSTPPPRPKLKYARTIGRMGT